MGWLDKLCLVAVIAWVGHILSTLAGIAARPPTPGPGEERLVPLWANETMTLDVSLTILPYVNKNHAEGDLPLLQLAGLPYSWDALTADLRIELVRSSSCSGYQAPQPHVTYPGLLVGTAGVCPVKGMRLVCLPSGQAGDVCTRLHAAAVAAGAASTPATLTKDSGMLLGEWDAAGRRRNTSATGAEGVGSPSLMATKVMALLDTSSEELYLQVQLGLPGFTALPLQRSSLKRHPHKGLIIFTPLFVRSPWVEPPVRRRLLGDPVGRRTAAAARANRTTAALPAASVAIAGSRTSPGVDPRVVPSALFAFLDGPDAPPVPPPGPVFLPPPGHLLPSDNSSARLGWPHFVTEVDVRLLMEMGDLPSHDQLPRQYAAVIRVGEDVVQQDGSQVLRRYYAPRLDIPARRPLADHLLPLNRTTTSIPLRVRLTPCSYGVGQLLHILHGAVSAQAEMGVPEKDTDDIIRVFTEHDMWVLAAVFIVSMLHLACDFLAMGGDIRFWATTTSLKGISVRTLGWQFLSQVIITGYVFTEGASVLVWAPQIGFTLIALGKYLRGSGLRCGRSTVARVIPVRYPYFDAAFRATAQQGPSSVYDAEATTFMGRVLTPLLVGYAVYSLVYLEFTGWWDWAISTAVSCVYAAGFAMMVPQLWINQRLRSVSRLPFSVFCYRAVNTFIDDAFAMLIRMPTLHKMAVFRDDIVFICYLAQRYWFPVDPERPAETFEGEEEVVAPVAEAAPACKPDVGEEGQAAAAEEPKKTK